MKLHELTIEHEYLIEVDMGRKTFELRKNDRDYQVGNLIRFIDIGATTRRDSYKGDCDVYIDEDTLYRITYVLKGVPEYGLDDDYCILGIKKLKIEEE